LQGHDHSLDPEDLQNHLRRWGDVLHAHAETQHREALEDQQEADGDHQTAQGVVAHGSEECTLHGNPHQADEDETHGHGEEERQLPVGIEGDHAIGAQHIKLAMGEVDDPHDAEDHHQADRHQGHEAGGVERVQRGLEEKLEHGHASPEGPEAGRSPAGFRGGCQRPDRAGPAAQPRWEYS
jgi:hypothetical protein